MPLPRFLFYNIKTDCLIKRTFRAENIYYSSKIREKKYSF